MMEKGIKLKCLWCDSDKTNKVYERSHWELPDGTKAVTITNVPSIHCEACEMVYIEDEIIEKIEDQLLLIDTTNLAKQFTYDDLMKTPRLLKRNYFNF